MEMQMLFQENLIVSLRVRLIWLVSNLQDLPCGGCHYCVHADQQWGHFTRDVNEAVNLTNSSSSTIANNTVDNQGSEFVLST